MTSRAMIEKNYTADLIPEPYEYVSPVEFTVCYDPEESEPWTVSSDAGCTTHSTLDEALFWELIIGGRHISEGLREKIVAECSGNSAPLESNGPLNGERGGAS